MVATARKFAGRSLLLGLFIASMGMPLIAVGLSTGAGAQASAPSTFPAPVHQTAGTTVAPNPASD
jgi:hypothetical protein